MIFKVPANIDKPLYSQIVKNPWDLKQGIIQRNYK